MIAGTARWSPTPAVRLSLLLHAAAIVALFAAPQTWPWLLAGVAGNHLVLAGFGMWPRSRVLGPNLTRLPDASRRRGEVALTFDDGPDPEVTPLVLDLLDRAGAKASFFCIGRRAEAHPGLVQDIVRRGHSVENHSHRHANLSACHGPLALRRDIMAAQAALDRLAGAPPRFFRAPIGLRSPLLDPALAPTGLRYVSWTRRGFDAVHGNPAAVLRRLTDRLAAGDILVLHDGSCAHTPDGTPVVLAVLPPLLALLARNNLRSVSLPMAFDAPEAAASSPVTSRWQPD